MQVVSNALPIYYLLQIDGIGILENLNGGSSYRVRSLLNWNAESPNVVRNWAARPPDWVEVRIPTRELGWQLTHLGADVLIIDERAGYKEAQNRGLLVTGTLGVLEKAANLGLVNLTEAVSRLLATNFRIRREFVKTALPTMSTAIRSEWTARGIWIPSLS